uniref:Uncharacterized protein n=1 Tax=Laticauda laticaudata TaxID=8630 RepID=A0A8C5RSG4_LATLA
MATYASKQGKRQDDSSLGSLVDLVLANARVVLGVSGVALLALAMLAVKRCIDWPTSLLNNDNNIKLHLHKMLKILLCLRGSFWGSPIPVLPHPSGETSLILQGLHLCLRNRKGCWEAAGRRHPGGAADLPEKQIFGSALWEHHPERLPL